MSNANVGSRLLVTMPPKSDESLTGYLVRLAGLNGYEGPGWVLAMAGLASNSGNWSWKWPSFVFRHGSDLERLRDLMGLSLAEIEALVYPPTNVAATAGDHRFYGSPVPISLLHPGRPKVCPACLQESQHCRRVWDFKFLTCCPLHGCFLVDECPDCDKRLKWYRPAACFCDCGFDLRQACSQPMQDAGARLSSRIYYLCGHTSRLKAEGIRGRNPLAALSLEETITAVLFMAGKLVRGGRVVGGRLSPSSNVEMHNLLVQTASIFEGWPGRFYDFIDSRRQKQWHSTGPLLNKQLGNFYTALFWGAHLSHTQFDFFREAFMNYLELRGEGYLIRRERLNLKYISMSDAAQRLGVSKKWMKRLISDGRINTVVQKWWGINKLRVEVESLEKLKEELSRLLSVKDVAKYLGVSRDLVVELTRSGCLVPERGPKVDGYKNIMFDPKVVENLMSDMTSLLSESDPPSQQCPNLMRAIERFGSNGIRVVAKIKAVRARKLLPDKRYAPVRENLCLPFMMVC